MIKLLQEDASGPLDKIDKAKLAEVVKSFFGTNFIRRWSDLAIKITMDAGDVIMNGRVEVGSTIAVRSDSLDTKVMKTRWPDRKK